MGQARKKQNLRQRNSHQRPGKNVKRRQHSQASHLRTTTKSSIRSKREIEKLEQSKQDQHRRFKKTYSLWDRLLLVGEGDFSFTLSLKKNFKVASVLATSYDSKEALEQKYPNVRSRLLELEDQSSQGYSHGNHFDEAELASSGDDWVGFSPSSDQSSTAASQTKPQREGLQVEVLHEIDATKLATAHKNILRRHAPFTKIIFNFPHVGGLSTDVNRQVRANQQLLVGFFNSAKPLLATSSNPAKSVEVTEDDWNERDSEDGNVESESITLAQGRILVTLFEGEPYTLWNIRDLARHCGLQVIESFQFPWAAYPGYKHARTVGEITTGRDRSEEGKRKGAWRGEERDARCYVLALKDEQSIARTGSKKRKKGNEESDESD